MTAMLQECFRGHPDVLAEVLDLNLSASSLCEVLMSWKLFCPWLPVVEDVLNGLEKFRHVNTHQFCYLLCRVFQATSAQPCLQPSLLKLLIAAHAVPFTEELDYCSRCVLKSAALRHADIFVLRQLQDLHLLDVHVIDNREENSIFEVFRRIGNAADDETNVLQWLLEQGVDPNRQNALGLRPLHAAALHMKTKAVVQLCKTGVDVNTQSDGNVCPSLQQLVAFHTDDPYVMGVTGSTPLHLALYSRQPINLTLVSALLACGADVTCRNCRGSTPIAVLFDCQTTSGPSHGVDVNSEQVWRSLIAAVVSKFGLFTLTLGARQAVCWSRWQHVQKVLQEEGVSMDFVPSLKTICWLSVRSCLGGCRFQENLGRLSLPDTVCHFLAAL